MPNFTGDLSLKLGRFLLALPMIVYGILHFVYAQFVANIVPPWMPWHVFWTYFTGVALIAAGVSLLTGKYVYLSAALLGTMILLFVLMIHTSLVLQKASEIPANSPFGDLPGRYNNCFKDLALSGAAFIFAGTQASGRNWAGPLGRTIFALCMAGFGVLHVIYPAFAPGIQPMFTSITFPIPGHLVWVYLTAVIFLVAAVGIAIRREERVMASTLAIMILVCALLIWGPRFGAHPGELWGNWLKDLGDAGGALILAGSATRAARPVL